MIGETGPLLRSKIFSGLAVLLGIGNIVWVSEAQQAIAQTTEPLTFVLTGGNFVTTRTVPGYAPRFSGVVGSGALVLNATNEVTGYYFSISSLEPGMAYVYHFHAAQNGSISTSCEGDKALFTGETSGAVITNLGAIAPIQPTPSGYAFVGSPGNPVQLPEPISLPTIGYLNIHPAPGGSVGPGIICANVRLDTGGFVR